MPQINTRLRQKIDTESNWNKATNFIPLDGEIIIYKADVNHPYERIKIGDGETTVINLPFVNSIDTNLTHAGQAADAKAVGDAISAINGTLNSFKDSIAFIDRINGYTYIVCMMNGSLVTYCATKSIEVTTMPTKTEYMAGEYFDPTGMVLTAITYDNITKEISNYIYSTDYLAEGATSVEITYVESGIIHTVTVPITVTPFNAATVLVDFEYTDNGDGTYTITGWKGTYNGAASTEIIIPNNGLIIV